MLNIEFKEGDINCDLFSLTKYISEICTIKNDEIINTKNNSHISYNIFKSAFNDLLDIFYTIHKIDYNLFYEVLSQHTSELGNIYYNKFWSYIVPNDKLIERLLHISSSYIDLDIDVGVNGAYEKYYLNSLIINEKKYLNIGVCDVGSNHLSELNIINGSMDKYSEFSYDARFD